MYTQASEVCNGEQESQAGGNGRDSSLGWAVAGVVAVASWMCWGVMLLENNRGNEAPQGNGGNHWTLLVAGGLIS